MVTRVIRATVTRSRVAAIDGGREREGWSGEEPKIECMVESKADGERGQEILSQGAEE